jgi:16S rRNA (adenine1518-N6/adenine1519-N6)-dimethyltransferase
MLESSRHSENMKSHPFLDIRAEELSVADFIAFANEWKNSL